MLIFSCVFSALGNDPQTIEEEYIYEPTGAKRKLKVPPLSNPRRPELWDEGDPDYFLAALALFIMRICTGPFLLRPGLGGFFRLSALLNTFRWLVHFSK